MNTKAFRTFSYGLYLVTSTTKDGEPVGCVVNTAAQVSSKPYQLLVTLNKDNATCKAVEETGRFAVTVLRESTSMDLLATFGFHSSADFDKFAGCTDVRELVEGVPCVADSAVAVFSCSVVSSIDAGTHRVFLGAVDEAETIDEDGKPLTYDYYHRVLKGTTPPRASAFISEEVVAEDARVNGGPEQGAELHHFRCLLCGYVVETSDEELPADFTCPLCGAPASSFKKVD